jgi:pyruvate dehydrogenase E1 component
VAADVWSATSYKELRRDALDCERWNLLHPTAEPRKSYLERTLANEKGVFVAASDYLKTVPDLIARWVPGGLHPLGTDGFGRSDSRPALRRFFEVDAESITLAALYQVMKRGEIEPRRVQQAIEEMGLNSEKANPMRS